MQEIAQKTTKLSTFKTSSITVIKDGCRCFGFKLSSEFLERRFDKFIFKRIVSDHTRLFYHTLFTYDIIADFFHSVLVFLRICILHMHVLPMRW